MAIATEIPDLPREQTMGSSEGPSVVKESFLQEERFWGSRHKR